MCLDDWNIFRINLSATFGVLKSIKLLYKKGEYLKAYEKLEEINFLYSLEEWERDFAMDNCEIWRFSK